jgi:ribosome-binding factor A
VTASQQLSAACLEGLCPAANIAPKQKTFSHSSTGKALGLLRRRIKRSIDMARIERVNQQVKREIGVILQRDLGDPRLQFVTVTEVDVSRDLRNAKVRYSVLGDSDQVSAAQKGLENAKGMIRRLLGQKVNMRYTPELLFSYDESIKISARIEETLKEIHDEHEGYHPNNQGE